jgi:hypothetical protein
VGEWVIYVILPHSGMKSEMGDEEGEFEVLDAQETVKPLWMEKEVNLHYLQPALGSVQDPGLGT